ncbi:Cold-regulated 413 plasma membrane protein 2 [Camellia lanceoleosa]|uniref:Cold-regulated 413 plasma membrane protein 2 n=1 Tax=Camellia lanceoleosa TaxID=1840588 RepID=A0ACC0INE3_9ERIC|nr:Cold-regulated 413 plasma membrane protein 2 [Camellia lanceoleosa]
MGKNSYLAMKAGASSTSSSSDLINSDLQDLGHAAKNLANHALKISLGFSLGSALFQWIASITAICLLVLDRTNWKTNILTTLLVPYIFMSLPSLLFGFLRGDIGKWVAFITVILRLFFPKQFPDWLEMPGALILLVVVAPGLIADTIRNNWIGIAICLAIACYLLQEHVRASGGFRDSFTKGHGLSNSVCIIILLVFPIWALFDDLL